MAKFTRTFTSGDKKVSVANEEVKFTINRRGKDYNYTVTYLAFETFGTAIKFKINGEDTIHWVDADSKIVFSDIEIDMITIITSGAEYYYTAFSEQ